MEAFSLDTDLTRIDCFEYVSSILKPITKQTPRDAVSSSNTGLFSALINLSDSNMFHCHSMAGAFLGCSWGHSNVIMYQVNESMTNMICSPRDEYI